MIFSTRPAVIGHRGLGAGPAENTISSMLGALEAGATWVEIDVQRTRDDRLVLRHDPTTAGGEFLIELTAAASGLVELTTALAALPPEAGVNLDIKTILQDATDPPHRRTGPLLVPVLTAEAARRPLLVTSFDAALLARLRDEVPGLPLGLLTWMTFPPGHAVPAAAGLGLRAVALHTGSLPLNGTAGGRSAADTVAAAHRAGLDVLVWCPAAAEVAGYAAAGVDAVIVNDVREAVAALG